MQLPQTGSQQALGVIEHMREIGLHLGAAMFIEHLAGSYTGVMGLPLCETAQLLKRFGYRD